MKLRFVLFLCIHCSVVWGQNVHCFLGVMNAPIPLYYDSIDESERFMYVYQDSVSEVYYDLEILDQSSSRFMVNLVGERDPQHQNTISWINKRDCAVWIWTMQSTRNEHVFRLFKEPNLKSEYKEFVEKNITTRLSEIIDYKESEWIKIQIKTQLGDYEGWTLNYCDNIYGFCEEGNPYQK